MRTREDTEFESHLTLESNDTVEISTEHLKYVKERTGLKLVTEVKAHVSEEEFTGCKILLT